MKLRDLRCSLRQKYLASRKLYRLVETDLFLQVFNSASDEAKIQAASYIESGDKQKLLNWMVSHNVELDLLPIRTLRERAQRAGVKWYNKLTRGQLIVEILREETGLDKENKKSSSEDEAFNDKGRNLREEIRKSSDICV